MGLQNTFVGIFLLLAISCDTDTLGEVTNFTSNKLVGTWQLSETYISPGGVTEWMDVDNGYIYSFDTNGAFRKTSSDGALQEEGSYRLEENELLLEFEFEGVQTTLGYRLELRDSTMTLSPSFPAICIEGCFYRFKRR